MRPVQFPESNIVLRRPSNMTEEQCTDVHAFVDGHQVVTAWRPEPHELVKLNLGEPVYLGFIGSTMPPAFVTLDPPFLQIADPHRWGRTQAEVIAFIATHIVDGLANSQQYLANLTRMKETLFWPHVHRLMHDLEADGKEAQA